ncbi:MAG: hypothetical protein PCFJNLEI_03895 [Verrucomicrobiae bacterium]|nr:hypothetical protein [Verrucomicrobiae bacterium]
MSARLLVVLLALPLVSHAEGLPGFEDFRRVDRSRRLLGQLQTAELLEVNQIDTKLILRTAQEHSNDFRVVWGAAELVVLWPQKQPVYEAALQLSSNSVPVALRYACAAARQGESELALRLARFGQTADPENTLPWLLELWVRASQKRPAQLSKDPILRPTTYQDYSAEASEARIRLLEKAGYSPYAARRLGFKADSDALLIIKELARPPIPEVTKLLLKDTATYLQTRRQFFLSEMIGQTIERTLFALREDVDRSVEVRVRTNEIEKRREEMQQLLGEMERNVIDYATEKQMVQYFNEVLSLGEEDAMRGLAAVVRRPSESK